MLSDTLYIGDVAISPPVLLAPMAGITNLPFRLLCRRLGAGAVCSEMISATALRYGSKKTLAMLASDPAERPLAIQLFGHDPEELAAAAALVCERARPELLDLNLGCTVPKVARAGAGAALLADPARAEAIVRAVARASSRPVTVKMRARWRQGYPDAVELGQRFEQAGAAALALHPRSATGKFSAPLEWDLAARLVAAVRVPVVVNGEIQDAATAGAAVAATGAAGVMVGRAALGNPWVFGEVATAWGGAAPKPPTRAERLAMAVEHGDLLAGAKGEGIANREMRKHVAWYARHFPDAVALRVAAAQARTWGEMRAMLVAAAEVK